MLEARFSRQSVLETILGVLRRFVEFLKLLDVDPCCSSPCSSSQFEIKVSA